MRVFDIQSKEEEDGSCLTTLNWTVDGVPDRFVYSVIEGPGAVEMRKKHVEEFYDFDPSRFDY